MFGVVVWSRRRVRSAVREAAALAGLRRGTSRDSTRPGWNLEESYRGRIDGVNVLLSTGNASVPSQAGPVALTGVLLWAEFEPSLSFRIEARRNAGVVSGNFSHPDDEFSRRCAIRTEDPPKAERLFTSSEARKRTIEFLREGQGSAFVNQDGVATVAFDAQWKGAPSILRRLRQMAGPWCGPSPPALDRATGA